MTRSGSGIGTGTGIASSLLTFQEAHISCFGGSISYEHARCVSSTTLRSAGGGSQDFLRTIVRTKCQWPAESGRAWPPNLDSHGHQIWTETDSRTGRPLSLTAVGRAGKARDREPQPPSARA